MKKLIFFCLLLISCNSSNSPNGTPIEPVVSANANHGYGVCRHEALIAAAIYEEAGYVTRIPYGELNNGNGWHVQAQVLIDDQWYWLTSRSIVVSIGSQDDFTVSKYYSVDELYENVIGGVWY